jgi:histidine triad (HIT) family protein
MSCIFCRIIEKKAPAKVFLEEKDIIVFADILPRAAIHLLVVPKEHFEKLSELPDSLISRSMETVKKITKQLAIEDNFRVILNNGAMAGQIVPHLHFHLTSNASEVEIKYIDRV